MAGMVFRKHVGRKLEERQRRAVFTAWRADALAPAKAFCRAFDVDDVMVEKVMDSAVANSVPLMGWAATTLKAAAMPAAQVMATVAAGGAVSAALFAAAGLALDWYYDDVATKKLGPIRESRNEVGYSLCTVSRAKNYFVVGAAVSDEAYDSQVHTQIQRIDPFFFSAKLDLSRLKDDTAAQRMLTNALIPPLLQNISTNNKTVVLMPGTIPEESARHIQEAMPDFYFRIVNRSHSHPELWAVRRGFEMLISRGIVATDSVRDVVMVGGSVRQVNKIPGVVSNYAPEITGRDEARHRLKGTASQRGFFRAVTKNQLFDGDEDNYEGACCVALYSTQDIDKRDFLKTCIRRGITKGYVTINIPVVMMDERILIWDDPVLNTRYQRQGDELTMTPLAIPVAGYSNSYSKTMSWVKPIKPIYGYDISMSAVAQVSSSYLLEFDIGTGRQEDHVVIWKMPDAGHYVLNDLMREDATEQFFTVPAQKFDQAVKFVIQLSGSKSVVEATAGRLMGLEAQIKIGGIVLERSWNTSHRTFASVMIHAIVCAGLCKSDSLMMLKALQVHFQEKEEVSLMGRIWRGYRKLLGLQVDHRRPKATTRGASDYDPVTHWTCYQTSGSGVGERFPASIAKPPKDSEGKTVSDDGSLRDEGYYSAEMLNEEEAGGSETESLSGEADAGPRETLVDKIAKWYTPKPEVPVQKDSVDIKPDDFCQRIKIGADELPSLSTIATFDPEGPLYTGQFGVGSASNVRFMDDFMTVHDLDTTISQTNFEIPAPDSGLVELIRKVMSKEPVDSIANASFMRELPTENPVGVIEQLWSSFLSEIDDETIRVPGLMLDGIAGAAKSSVVRSYIRTSALSTAIVCPTSKLAKDWRGHRLGTTVTKHKLMLKTLRGRKLLVVDEAYAYSRQEMFGLLWKARAAGCKVLLLGDRSQQYEDGGELAPSDFSAIGTGFIRMLVSNTMPADSLKVARWASQMDPFVDLMQTRSSVVHSVWFKQKDQAEDADMLKSCVNDETCVVFKDRAGPELHYESISDSELGFQPGQEDDWLSTSRVQGMRAKNSVMLSSRFTKAEKWFADQPGLFYVALSRHSKSMFVACDQYELSRFSGLEFEAAKTVQGRLARVDKRERFQAPYFILQASIPKESPVLTRLYQNGLNPQTLKFVTGGPILEDWRPWNRLNFSNSHFAADVMEATTKRLVGERAPYVATDAVKKPVYPAAMGLWSLRRPWVVAPEPVNAKFIGMDRLAVLQNSKDELLDQKNVVERTARPRILNTEELSVSMQSRKLFDQMKKLLFKEEGEIEELHLSTEPAAADWASTRTSDFARKLVGADRYGETAHSTRSQGFLKTQVKVKLKREFALEENYGQTVLASPADFNAVFGPWSKLFLRNVRLMLRRGVIADTGYSDKELAKELRDIGAFGNFDKENYQADVKRQDTSHNPVTLRVFCLFLEFLGLPKDLCDLYELHSARFEYQSMKAGLYRGEARYNLGSGDPFTLIRNIFEVFTVMVERFGEQLEGRIVIVKGDDCIIDKVMVQLPPSVPDVRATQLTEDFNAPPYHAGRFLLSDDIVPDPVRMVAKILVKRTDSADRLNELAESFYDRYVHLNGYSYNQLRHYVTRAYQDFEPEFPVAALDLYHALRDRSLFYELLADDEFENDKKLVVINPEQDCARQAAGYFTTDAAFVDSLANQDKEVLYNKCKAKGIPVYVMRGNQSDLLRRGVWLSEDHAWAVIGLTEFKELGIDHDEN